MRKYLIGLSTKQSDYLKKLVLFVEPLYDLYTICTKTLRTWVVYEERKNNFLNKTLTTETRQQGSIIRMCHHLTINTI